MEPDEESIRKWLRKRIIPSSRAYATNFLAQLGLNEKDTKGIIDICKGLSLNDCYWVVDEIFKGTNSADRIVCAKTALEKLHLSWIITFVSTHDFELCDMDKTMNAENYHFSEYYEDDKILFDYTLKEGRCTTTNAKQLMKMAGF